MPYPTTPTQIPGPNRAESTEMSPHRGLRSTEKRLAKEQESKVSMSRVASELVMVMHKGNSAVVVVVVVGCEV